VVEKVRPGRRGGRAPWSSREAAAPTRLARPNRDATAAATGKFLLPDHAHERGRVFRASVDRDAADEDSRQVCSVQRLAAPSGLLLWLERRRRPSVTDRILTRGSLPEVIAIDRADINRLRASSRLNPSGDLPINCPVARIPCRIAQLRPRTVSPCGSRRRTRCHQYRTQNQESPHISPSQSLFSPTDRLYPA
jgi:hypothetical protein